MALENSRVDAVISCTDLNRALTFYTQTLGLTKSSAPQPGEGHVFVEAGSGTRLLIYHRPEPPKAENTVLGFEVTNIEGVMNELRGKGVKFEEYDFPGLKTVNGVANLGGYKSAWFKDPDGNIISLGEVV